MREYIRHPSDIPIQFQIDELAINDTEYLNNVSFGGLSFRSKVRVKAGTVIAIKIPFVQPSFEAHARVKWCRKRGEHFNVGAVFIDSEEAFQARMVEQICHIEHYKREVELKEGRHLTGEQAALEWINRYADKFPEIKLKRNVQKHDA